MDVDIGPRIDTAHHLVDEIKRLGAGDHWQSCRGRETNIGYQHNGHDGSHSAGQGRALPVSSPNRLADRLLAVVVADTMAKAELSNRLHETRANLLDLCDRQLNDLVDAAPSEQRDVEDIDKLLDEMRSVRRSMETVIALEAALNNNS